jgi:hypothetical protein
MEQNSIQLFGAPKGEFLEPPQSSKPITASSFELRPGFIAMVRERSFSGFDDENPYNHLREFELLCACLKIKGVSHETLRWKLFPFSLEERAKQWYTHNVGKVNGDWEELRNNFCLAFFPLSRIGSLRNEILNFHQKEKETIGAAWERFSILANTGPDLSLPNHVLLQHFWFGLSKESALQLDLAAGGSFNHKTIAEGEELLRRFLENTPLLEPLRVEPNLKHEEVSSAMADPKTPIQRPSPEPEILKEGFQPSKFHYFEDVFHENHGDTSKYS